MRKSMLAMVGVLAVALAWLLLLQPTSVAAEQVVSPHHIHAASAPSGDDPMEDCFGTAGCDGYVFTFTHPLVVTATIGVFYEDNGDYIMIGSSVVPPNGDPMTVVTGDYMQEPPIGETPVRFVVDYNGRVYHVDAIKPDCSPPTAVSLASLSAGETASWPRVAVIAGISAAAMGASAVAIRRRKRAE